MKKTIKRTAFVSFAIFLGIGLVLLFSFIGDVSQGPLDKAFRDLGERVTNVEKEWLLTQRQPIRSKKLSWFNKFRQNKMLLQNPDTILLGVFDNTYQNSFEQIIELDSCLGGSLPIIQIYKAWGDKESQEFPSKYVEIIYDLGSIPLITWEPWLNDFDAEKHSLKQLADPNIKGMLSIVNGDYDFYIDEWAARVKDFGRQIFIRLGHEMNDPYRYPWGPQNNKPEDFVAAWKHVVNRFQLIGADNVLWVWAPQPSYLMYKEYYPGAEYVDWVGVGALNYGSVASWSQWWTFKETFGNYYDSLEVFEKPMMVAELGCLTVGGDRKLWFTDAFTNMPAKYPRLKAVVFFNDAADITILNKALNWSILNDSSTCNAIQNAIQSTW